MLQKDPEKRLPVIDIMNLNYYTMDEQEMED
jgi:hypothetical protein